MKLKSPVVLLVGNFISNHPKRTRQVCEDLADQLQQTGWTVIRTSFHLNKLRRIVDMVLTTVRFRNHYDVAYVEVFSGPSFIWAEIVTWIIKLIGKPYILTLHGGNLPNFSQRWPLRVQRLLNSAAEVIAPSEYLRQQMQPYCARIKLLPNAINIDRYMCRSRTSVTPSLLWLRALSKEYNPELLLHAASLLIPDFPGLRISMVGPDKGVRLEIGNLHESLNLSAYVHIHGRIDKVDVPKWMDGHDIFVNTSNIDNTPVSVIEAMASGLVIISTNVGGIPYLLDHNYDALLISPNDPGALAKAIHRVLKDPDLATHLSQNALTKASQFDWKLILPQWKEILHNTAFKRKDGEQWGS